MTIFLTGLALGLVLTPVIRWGLIRWRLIDVPNARSSHAAPVPRGGGIAVAIAASAAMLLGDRSASATAILLGALTLGVVGLVDDRVSLPTTPRLVAQVVVPAGAMAWLLAESSIGDPWTIALGIVGVVWCAGYVNAFNFMDGINGISAAQALGAGLTLAALADRLGVDPLVDTSLAVAGAVLGFAVFNVAGRIFLGDVGSYFLGFWLAASAVVAVARDVPVESVLTPFVLYVVDTGTTLVRRWRRGADVREAHREHAYQRLHQLGWSHLSVSLLVASVVGVSGAIGVAVADAGRPVRLVGLAVAVVLAGCFVAAPAAFARSRTAP